MECFKLIHPTKTGGTYICDTLYAHKLIPKPRGHHGPVCDQHPNPIISLREPVDRFKSMYKYWRFGGYKYGASDREGGSVDDFIDAITSASHELNTNHTSNMHVKPQTYWIKPSDYSKTIVVRYTDDMSSQVKKLLEYLEITSDSISSDRINKSMGDDFELTREQKIFVENFYQEDFDLWSDVSHRPSLFKHVI